MVLTDRGHSRHRPELVNDVPRQEIHVIRAQRQPRVTHSLPSQLVQLGLFQPETDILIVNNIIISLIMSTLLGHRPSSWITHKENGPYPPSGRCTSAGWWVLTTANAAGTSRVGLTCLPKYGGARDSKFLVTHPMTLKPTWWVLARFPCVLSIRQACALAVRSLIG
jgi:hypothetical protein